MHNVCVASKLPDFPYSRVIGGVGLAFSAGMLYKYKQAQKEYYAKKRERLSQEGYESEQIINLEIDNIADTPEEVSLRRKMVFFRNIVLAVSAAGSIALIKSFLPQKTDEKIGDEKLVDEKKKRKEEKPREPWKQTLDISEEEKEQIIHPGQWIISEHRGC